MIHSISSDLPDFKNLEFSSGLNVVAAKSEREDSEHSTRNRAGKTSLIRLIHFLTGNQPDKDDSIFRTSALGDNVFNITIDIGSSTIEVKRSGDNHQYCTLNLKSGSADYLSCKFFEDSDVTQVRRTDWRRLLSREYFDLPDYDDSYTPSFSALFAYLVRKEYDGGFSSPTTQHERQYEWDIQVHISYLLGLDWEIPREFQLVRKRERRLQKLRKSITEGQFSKIIGDVADIRSELAITRNKIEDIEQSINEFRIVEEYRSLEEEADELTDRINRLSDKNTIDRNRIQDMQEALESEEPPSLERVHELYEKADVTLPEKVTEQFESVQRFHQSVVENRQSYLEGEIDEARSRIENRKEEIESIEDRRSEIFEILDSGGALEQFSELQSELNRLESKAEVLEEKLDMAQTIQEDKAKLEMQRSRLKLRLQQDHDERESRIDSAIQAFEEVSKSLYNSAGQFQISASDTGPKFEVSMHGDSSKGVTNMQVFCFDMMIMQLLDQRNIGPSFLVHDSHLFDGVDERQVGKALSVGKRLSEKHNFQYIVTINTDDIPKERWIDFDLSENVVSPVLTDEENGGLFGFRFD